MEFKGAPLTLGKRGEEVEKGSSVVCWLDFSLCVSVEFKGAHTDAPGHWLCGHDTFSRSDFPGVTARKITSSAPFLPPNVKQLLSGRRDDQPSPTEPKQFGK